MGNKTYVAGPMTGHPGLNKHAFNEAAARLRAEGREVFNPVDNGLPDSAEWHQHMRADITMLVQCDCIHLLPGWQLSKGARLERQIALQLGLTIELPETAVELMEACQ